MGKGDKAMDRDNKVKTYSQHGEDQFMLEFFISHNLVVNPVFIDIGAYDGVTFSNSKLFELLYGWKTVLVDANEEVISKAGGFHEYIVPKRNLYGKFHFDSDKWGLAYVETSTKHIGKKCITLADFLTREGYTLPDQVGVLSLDVEGQEDAILEELFDHSKVRPIMVCVEGNTSKAKSKLRAIMDKDYIEIGELNVNLIFVRKDYRKFEIMKSKLVKYSDWRSDYFDTNAKLLGIPAPVSPQRKYWEFIEILQILKERLDLCNSYGIGFGVGEEPMTSTLAHLGAKILATDIGANHKSSNDWNNGQLARSKLDLYKPDLVSKSVFDRNVEFQELDMNDITRRGDLNGKFDFTFSCGSVEHIGGIDQTINFLVSQMECLKPGGLSIHTTEYNLDSNENTLNAHNICLLRQKDIRELQRRIEEQGDIFHPVDYSLGEEPEDLFIDEPPHSFKQHLKLKSCGITHTSILLICQKGNR